MPVLPRAQWLRLAQDEADRAQLRADARRNVLAVARVIGWSADKHTLRSRPTLARIINATGLTRRCVQHWCRWLEARGLLEVLEPGTTPQYRPTLLRRGHAGNLAREWRLTVPPVEQSCTPPVVSDLEEDPPARARDNGVVHMDRAARGQPAEVKVKTEEARAARGLPVLPRTSSANLHDHPKTRSEALTAARALQDHSEELGQLSARAVRHLARPFVAAGWTPADVLHALDHAPGGRRHGYTAAVRSASGWAAARLALWTGPDGVLPPSPSQLRAEAERIRVAEQAARQARAAADRAAGVDAAGPAAAARQMLAAASPAAARVIDLARMRAHRPSAADAHGGGSAAGPGAVSPGGVPWSPRPRPLTRPATGTYPPDHRPTSQA